MDYLDPQRYTVYIAPGERAADAVAAHRERTGYGGTVVLVRDDTGNATTLNLYTDGDGELSEGA